MSLDGIEAITLSALAGGVSAWVDVAVLRYPLTVTIAPGVGGTASIETATTVAEPLAADVEAAPEVTGIAALESFLITGRVNWMRLSAVTANATARIVQWGRQ